MNDYDDNLFDHLFFWQQFEPSQFFFFSSLVSHINQIYRFVYVKNIFFSILDQRSVDGCFVVVVVEK